LKGQLTRIQEEQISDTPLRPALEGPLVERSRAHRRPPHRREAADAPPPPLEAVAAAARYPFRWPMGWPMAEAVLHLVSMEPSLQVVSALVVGAGRQVCWVAVAELYPASRQVC